MEKMEWKVAKEMTRISQHGSNGFSLLESVVSIFIASLSLCSLLVLVSSSIKSSSKTTNLIDSIIEEYNHETEIIIKK